MGKSEDYVLVNIQKAMENGEDVSSPDQTGISGRFGWLLTILFQRFG